MNQILKNSNENIIENISTNTLNTINTCPPIKNNLNFKIRKHKKIFIIIFYVLLLIILLTLFFCTFFALININNQKIFNNISINGIDVSNLTKKEAKNKLNTEINKHLSKEITLTRLNFEGILNANQIGIKFNIDKALDLAYSYGKTQSIFHNNFDILNLNFKNINIPLEISANDQMITDVVKHINPLLPDKIINSDYYIDNNSYSLVLIPGKNGTIVDELTFKNNILNLLLDFNNTNIKMEIPIKIQNSKPLNIDEIYNSIYKPSIDASFTTNPYNIIPSSLGVDLSIPISDLKELLNNYQDKYVIPLKTLYPKVYTDKISLEAFPDLLSSFTTSFNSSSYSRSTNITIASQKINGKVLMPGETFSFNQIVGQRTKQNGYKEATAYSNGKIIETYGGGICQVSSTLYNAVLYSNLEIIERTNHGYKPSYVKPGLDATVSWGAPDFKFKNNRDYPIKLITDTSGKQLRIFIYGLRKNNDYIVKLESKFLSTIPYKKTYQKDSSLKKGQSRIIKYGSNGCKTITYKHLYDLNGNYIKTECISKDIYNPHNRIIAIGN